MSLLPLQQTRLRSFVRRDGRKTKAQVEARTTLLSTFGLHKDHGEIQFESIFERIAPTYLEIGFGTGQSLLALAKNMPDKNFIGVETHRPGVGALLLGMKNQDIKNIRIYEMDVVDVLETCIPKESLAGVQIFFPDPWPKRRHHPRRLIQATFLDLLIQKLKPNATLHLATDWEDYALHMMKVLTEEVRLVNVAGYKRYAERSPFRPILTKFEGRALREGRVIREFQFVKV